MNSGNDTPERRDARHDTPATPMQDTAVKIGLRVREVGWDKEGIVTDVWRDDRRHWWVEIDSGTSYPLDDILVLAPAAHAPEARPEAECDIEQRKPYDLDPPMFTCYTHKVNFRVTRVKGVAPPTQCPGPHQGAQREEPWKMTDMQAVAVHDFVGWIEYDTIQEVVEEAVRLGIVHASADLTSNEPTLQALSKDGARDDSTTVIHQGALLESLRKLLKKQRNLNRQAVVLNPRALWNLLNQHADELESLLAHVRSE
jgi:hypothetical protein